MNTTCQPGSERDRVLARVPLESLDEKMRVERVLVSRDLDSL